MGAHSLLTSAHHSTRHTEMLYTEATSLSTQYPSSDMSSYLPSLTLAILLSSTGSTTPSTPHVRRSHSHSAVTHHTHAHSITHHNHNVTASLSSLFAATSTVPLLTRPPNLGLTSTSAVAASTAFLNQSELESDAQSSSSMVDGIDSYLLYFSLNRNILVALLLGTIMIFTIVGNLMVIWAIFHYRPLHIVQNMFLVSLAVADIAVAVLVMPFNVAYSLLDRWVFGLHLCEMWLTSDVLCCTASILNLCAIALDRYWAIHDPINYAQKRTMNRVCTSIGIVWILSAIISIPPLIGWNDWPEEFNDETPCRLSEEKMYLIYSSSGSFYIPLLIMTVVYFKIFRATRRRLKDRAKASAMANLGHTSNTTAGQQATVSTPTTGNYLTKISSNEESSSSNSPKTSHIKARCIRCCCTSRGDKSTKGSKSKGKLSRKNNSYLREARIEIESASDEHSRNEVSSSDAYGLTSGVVSCPHQSTLHNCTTKRVIEGELELPSASNGVNRVASSGEVCPSQTLASPTTEREQSAVLTANSSGTVHADHYLPMPGQIQFNLNSASVSTTTDATLFNVHSNSFRYKSSSDQIINMESGETIPCKSECNQIHNSSAVTIEPSGQSDLVVPSGLSVPQTSTTSGKLQVVSCLGSPGCQPSCYLSGSTDSNNTTGGTTSSSMLARTTPQPAQSQVSVKKIWEEKQKISLSRERRATRILGIVMGVFVACWLPFFLMYLIVPFCESCYVSRELENFITWLGYINSALNPLIYCGFNRDFRRAFQRILSCKKV